MVRDIPTMETYIARSPQVFEDNLRRGTELVAPMVELFSQQDAHEIRLIASGSSYNACAAVRPFMEQVLSVRVDVLTPSRYLDEFERLERIASDSFEVFISQSGCSTNIIEAACAAREHGHVVIGLTGNVEADLRAHVDSIVEWGVGNETVDFVTLGVVTLMEFWALFALQTARERSVISDAEWACWMEQLACVPELHEAVQSAVHQLMDEHARTFLSPGPAFVCGAGAAYGTALEGALKWQETLKCPATPLEPEEYIHGPNMLLSPRSTVIFLDPVGYPGRTFDIYRATREVTDRAFLIAAYDNPDARDDHVIGVHAEVDPTVAPFFLLPAVQLFAARGMRELDCEECHPLFDRFERLVKCKTDDYDDVQKRKLEVAGYAVEGERRL